MRFKIHSCIYKRDYATGRGAKVLHTDIHTDRPSDEAGPRGAFAPKNRAQRGMNLRSWALFTYHLL